MNGPRPLRTNWPSVPVDFIPPPEPDTRLEDMLDELRAFRDNRERSEFLARHQDVLQAHDERQVRLVQNQALIAELESCAEAGLFHEPEPEPMTEQQMIEAIVKALSEAGADVAR
jgi:hypothetical protein